MTSTIGLIGVGRIGTMHAENLQKLAGQNVELIITDADTARAHHLAKTLGCRVAASTEELFANKPDGVVIAVGTHQHAPLIISAAEAGIPAFCEKPVAESTEVSAEVLEAIQRTGATVQIGHQRRLDAGYQEAQRAYRAGELGWLHTIRAVTGDVTPPPVEFLATSAGLFHDCSVHDFDILQWLTGQKIVEVYGTGSNLGDPAIGEVGDVDSAVALATFEDGTVATVSATRYNGAGHDVRLELHGSEGTTHVGLDASYAGSTAETGFDYPSGATHSTFHERFAEAYAEEIRAFVQLVRGDRENPCTAADAVDASRVADAAQRSLESRRPMPVIR